MMGMQVRLWTRNHWRGFANGLIYIMRCTLLCDPSLGPATRIRASWGAYHYTDIGPAAYLGQ